ncbi:uncharacterized protein LOC111618322 [Centruroides sculpturatus]|uniref:uncharacterized protein LOC111618322 n=1 Tax=Centruroides sculpturatus TaxID=218467 RepID=UPI000C6E0AF8|nr:uncharacterized protein LOC111618322 [Centruroides sculpturatus]
MPFTCDISASQVMDPATIFDNITSYSFLRYFSTEEAAQKFCHFVPHPDLTGFFPPCPKCGGTMRKEPAPSDRFGFVYRCEKVQQKKMRRRASGTILRAMCTGSVLHSQHLFRKDTAFSPRGVNACVNAWVKQEPVTVDAEECGVAPKTAVDWYNYCREVAEVFVSYQQDI